MHAIFDEDEDEDYDYPDANGGLREHLGRLYGDLDEDGILTSMRGAISAVKYVPSKDTIDSIEKVSINDLDETERCKSSPFSKLPETSTMRIYGSSKTSLRSRFLPFLP